MKIVITVQSMDPPLGCVTSCVDEQATPGDGDDGVEFVGWLGLLRVLDELIGGEGREPDWP